jgi:hypothetical protein
MNTLTKNRILQKGDEYFDDDKGWKPVSKDNFGLQVMFSGYSEVRRPSEKPAKNLENGKSLPSLPVPPVKAVGSRVESRPHSPPISPDSGERPAAKAEKEKTPVPTPSGTGDVSYLPTVVSRKAHTQESDREIIDNIPYDLPMTDEEKAALDREADREKAEILDGNKITLDAARKYAAKASGEPFTETEKTTARAKLESYLKLKFPNAGPVPLWTGRNGTFNGYGLEASTVGDMVLLYPVGKRGVGNCMIQLPVSVASKLASWLLEQATPKK